MTGWIKLHRRILDHEVFQDPLLFKVFAWCLLRATHKETSVPVRTGVGITTVVLKPGELIFGRNQSARDLGLTPSTTRRKLERLKTLQILDIQPDTHFSIISIINWHLYQDDFIQDEQAPGQAPDRHRTHTRMLRSKTFSSDSSEIRLASLLLERIVSRLPGFKKPDLQKWAVEIDRMVRIDERPPEEIRRVIEWSQADNFWQNNILSAGKLRKQFDQLRAKMPRPSPTKDSDHEAPRPLTCPGCGRSVLSTDMDGPVCIRCASKGAAHA